MMIKHEELLRAMTYNPQTGIFSWNKSRRGIRDKNNAGCVTKRGYVNIYINNKKYLAHRLAWFYVHGEWPAEQIDHINGRKDDNSIDNLRLANGCENQLNRRKDCRNTSGIKGVCWHKNNKKWQAQTSVNGKEYYLGQYTNIKDAERAVIDFRNKHHKEFINHG